MSKAARINQPKMPTYMEGYNDAIGFAVRLACESADAIEGRSGATAAMHLRAFARVLPVLVNTPVDPCDPDDVQRFEEVVRDALSGVDRPAA